MLVDRRLLFPIKIAIVYLLCTLLLYAIGPIAWVTYNPVYFWFLQFLYILMLFLGWMIGISKTYTSQEEWKEEKEKKIIKMISLPIWINLFYEVINTFRRFQFASFNLSGLINRMIIGINDMGGSYNSFQDSVDSAIGSSVVGGSLFTLFNYFWEFFSMLILLLSTLYLKKLKKAQRVIVIITYIIVISSYVSIGTNIGVFRLVLMWCVFLLTKMFRGEQTYDGLKWKKRKKWILLFALIGVVTCTMLFDKIMQSRGGILLWQTPYYNIGGIGINRSSILLKILPPSWSMLLVAATSYLTQGYYGMSLCLRVPWEPTFLMGHSMAIEKLLKEYLTEWPYLHTYQHRIQQFGWDENVQWHTMYTWFANDFGFLGTAIVVLILGILFGASYKDAIRTNNPFAYVMVYFFTLAIFFAPCNNQLFQSTYVLFSFITALICWLCTRGRTRIKIVIGNKR